MLFRETALFQEKMDPLEARLRFFFWHVREKVIRAVQIVHVKIDSEQSRILWNFELKTAGRRII